MAPTVQEEAGSAPFRAQAGWNGRRLKGSERNGEKPEELVPFLYREALSTVITYLPCSSPVIQQVVLFLTEWPLSRSFGDRLTSAGFNPIRSHLEGLPTIHPCGSFPDGPNVVALIMASVKESSQIVLNSPFLGHRAGFAARVAVCASPNRCCIRSSMNSPVT